MFLTFWAILCIIIVDSVWAKTILLQGGAFIMTMSANELLEVYNAQVSTSDFSAHDNGHDNSGSDGPYHNDSHDNNPND